MNKKSNEEWKNELVELFAECFHDKCSPDGGWEKSVDVAKEAVEYMSIEKIKEMVKDVASGDSLLYDVNFGDFYTQCFLEEDDYEYEGDDGDGDDGDDDSTWNS